MWFTCRADLSWRIHCVTRFAETHTFLAVGVLLNTLCIWVTVHAIWYHAGGCCGCCCGYHLCCYGFCCSCCWLYCSCGHHIWKYNYHTCIYSNMNLIGATNIYAFKLSLFASYVRQPNSITNRICFFQWPKSTLTSISKRILPFQGLCRSDLGLVVQSVVSLTTSLRVISLTVLADSILNILIFFAEKKC